MNHQNKNDYILKTKSFTSINHHQQRRFISFLFKYKKLKFFIIFLILFLIILYISYKIITSPQLNSYNILRSYIHNYDNDENNLQFRNRQKTILLWTDFFGDLTWDINEINIKNNYTVNETYFQKHNCLYKNCIITGNRNLLPSIDLYDALLFHTAEPFLLHEFLPSKRNIKQLYIFAILESPAHTKHDLNDEINIYNLTMTYRLDSDIIWPYCYIEDINSNKIIAPSIQKPNWKIPTFEHLINNTKLLNLIQMKTKFAAWFVSHCNTISKRDDVVKILQEYVDVDIYGECGNLR